MGRSVISKAVATCAVTMLALGASVFVAAAPAGAALFGVSILKDCQTPINVGDPYSCEFEISNTVQTSQNTVTTDQLTDAVFASGGTVTQVTPINSATAGLILSGGATCDPLKCTIPFGGAVTTSFMSHYTTVIGDFPGISDTGTFRWKNVCDVVSSGCSTNDTEGSATASAEINPIPTSVVTAIHDAAHNAVTAVAAGSTVHDFVTVSGQQNQPNPTGNVNIDWFLNGDCSGAPASNSGSVGPLDANGQFDATAFSFTVPIAGLRSFLAHYEGEGAFLPSDGVCEPLNVVDANIQITPPDATNQVGADHVLTGHVNVDDGTGPVSAPDGTLITFSILSGPGSFVGPDNCTTSGGTGSCTVTISSAATGQTVIRASTDVTVAGVSLHRETGDTNAGDGPDANKEWVNAAISIAPSATNEVGMSHTFTVTLEKDTGSGLVPAAGEHVDVTLTDSNGAASILDAGASTCDDAGPNTDAAGQCTMVFTSNSAGQVTGHATATLTINGLSVTVQTNGVAPNSGDAVKTFVDANIQISPPTATNPTDTNHVLTSTVMVDDGSGGGLVPAPDGTLIHHTIQSGPGSFVGSADCTTSGGTGSCTVTITSSVAGTTVVQATTTLLVGGISLTRTTGDGLHNDGPDAQKTWVPPVVGSCHETVNPAGQPGSNTNNGFPDDPFGGHAVPGGKSTSPGVNGNGPINSDGFYLVSGTLFSDTTPIPFPGGGNVWPDNTTVKYTEWGNSNIVITPMAGPNSVITYQIQAPGDLYVGGPQGDPAATFCGVPPPPF